MTVFHKARKGGAMRGMCVIKRHFVPSLCTVPYHKRCRAKPNKVHGENINAVLISVSPQRKVPGKGRHGYTTTPLTRLVAGREVPVFTDMSSLYTVLVKGQTRSYKVHG